MVTYLQMLPFFLCRHLLVFCQGGKYANKIKGYEQNLVYLAVWRT